jgi:hypothetical protein
MMANKRETRAMTNRILVNRITMTGRDVEVREGFIAAFSAAARVDHVLTPKARSVVSMEKRVVTKEELTSRTITKPVITVRAEPVTVRVDDRTSFVVEAEVRHAVLASRRETRELLELMTKKKSNRKWRVSHRRHNPTIPPINRRIDLKKRVIDIKKNTVKALINCL